jgi:hypothetical protein
VTSMSWGAGSKARAALRAVMADPRYGPAALSNLPHHGPHVPAAGRRRRAASSEPLGRFSGGAPALAAKTIDVVVDHPAAASTAVSKMSEAGADKDALAQQLPQAEAVPGSALDDDQIL